MLWLKKTLQTNVFIILYKVNSQLFWPLFIYIHIHNFQRGMFSLVLFSSSFAMVIFILLNWEPKTLWWPLRQCLFLHLCISLGGLLAFNLQGNRRQVGTKAVRAICMLLHSFKIIFLKTCTDPHTQRSVCTFKSAWLFQNLIRYFTPKGFTTSH